MADVYVSIVGFVQFEPTEREANGKAVRDVAVKPAGKADGFVRLTVWPEYSDVEINQGDFIAAEGKFTKSTYQTDDGSKRESQQISVKRLKVLAPEEPAERDVVRSSESADAVF